MEEWQQWIHSSSEQRVMLFTQRKVRSIKHTTVIDFSTQALSLSMEAAILNRNMHNLNLPVISYKCS